MKEEHIPEITESKLYDDVCAIIEDTRYRVAVYVNSEACRMNTSPRDLSRGMAADGVSRNCNIVYALRILFRRLRSTTQCVDN